MNYRQALLEKIKSFDFGRHGQPPPVVSLEDFFMGNNVDGSIGCNLDELLSPAFFFETLQNIRERANVQDVLVEITDIDTLGEPFNEWAFSDRIYILTSANQTDVAGWLEPLRPDEVEEDWAYGKPHQSAPQILDGHKVYTAWWD